MDGRTKDTLRLVEGYNSEGIACSLSRLPTIQCSPDKIASELDEHLDMLQAIHDNGLDCDITVKSQMFGIYGAPELAASSIEAIVRRACMLGSFVWLDMEQTASIGPTIGIFRTLHRKHGHCGICVQAYLKRSDSDLDILLQNRAPVRLVKGFYRDHDIAPWSLVTRNYEALMQRVLTSSDYPALATHDTHLVASAARTIREQGIANAEFQFFQGVRDGLARDLAAAGFRVRIYLPLGSVWRFLIEGISRFDLWHQAQRMIGIGPKG